MLVRRHSRELIANLLAIALIPFIARALWPRFSEAFTTFGFGDVVGKLAGLGGWTDAGWEVASAVGLIRPDFKAYDSLEVLHPLIGMELEFVDLSVHSHPPMSIPLGIPLGFIDYGWWLSFWVVASFCAIALTMRLLRVAPHIAYPLAVVIGLSVPGKWALVSTYPLSALLVALAWRMRARPIAGGVSYGLLGATRGIGLILLLYPLVHRQWKTIMVAVGTVLALLLIALAFEPTIIADFLTTSRDSITANMQRDDLLTIGSFFRRWGLPEYLAWIIALVVALIAYLRKQELFWILNWLILAVSPIAWFHTIILGIPLMVVLWKSGRLGQVLVLITAAAAISQPVNPFTTLVFSTGWTVFIIASGIGIIACKIPRRPLPGHTPKQAGANHSV